MTPLHTLFDVSYGNKLDLNKMNLLPASGGGVYFVGRSSENHGISAVVAALKGMAPYESGLITVSLGGTKLLSAFVQERPFYTAQNVAILKPKTPMAFAEKIFVCLCIRHNRFRYSAFGREANKTLKDLLVPERSKFPNWGGGCGFRGKAKRIPGRTRKRFRDEDEQDSGLKANSDSGGKANGFRPIPEWLSRCPECFSRAYAALDITSAQ